MQLWAACFLGALAFLSTRLDSSPRLVRSPVFECAAVLLTSGRRKVPFARCLKGVVVSLAAAAAHHVTLIFGTVLFAGPVLWLACRMRMMVAREVQWGSSRRALRLLQPSWVLASGCSAPLLAHSASASDPPDSNSARQPIELLAEFHYWHQLLRDSLWRFDPGSAVHLIPRCCRQTVASVVDGFLDHIDFWVGRHHPATSLASRTSIRHSDIRTLYLLGHAHGNADRGYPRA